MQWPATSKSHQHHVTGVLAPLDSNGAYRARHIDVGDLADAVCGIIHAELQWTGDMVLYRCLRKHSVDRERATGKRMRIEKTENHVRIRDRWLLRTTPVARWARITSRAFRPNHEEPTDDDTRNRAAACTDFGNGECRDLQHVACTFDETGGRGNSVAKFVFGDELRFTTLHNRGLCRRPAHVENDEILRSDRASKSSGTDNATGGPGANRKNRGISRGSDTDHTAIGGHDLHRRRYADVAEALGQL